MKINNTIHGFSYGGGLRFGFSFSYPMKFADGGWGFTFSFSYLVGTVSLNFFKNSVDK